MILVIAKMTGMLEINAPLAEKQRLVKDYNNRYKNASTFGYTRRAIDDPDVEWNFSHHTDEIYILGEKVYFSLAIVDTIAGNKLLNCLETDPSKLTITTIFNKVKKVNYISRLDFITKD